MNVNPASPAMKKLNRLPCPEPLLLSQGPTIEATHQQLADELGSVREVIGRLLWDFQDKGAIVLDRRHLQILDKVILQQIAHSERDASLPTPQGGYAMM